MDFAQMIDDEMAALRASNTTLFASSSAQAASFERAAELKASFDANSNVKSALRRIGLAQRVVKLACSGHQISLYELDEALNKAPSQVNATAARQENLALKLRLQSMGLLG